MQTENGSPTASNQESTRLAGIDAARVFATLLVVLHHTAITYGAIGGWFYKEVLPNSSPSSRLLVFFCTLNQAWFMGFFFLLAGYFTAPALHSRGPGRYLRERLLRLGLPLLFFGFVLGPFTIALARTAQGHELWGSLLGLWQRGVFEMGPLWFAWALLLLTGLTLPAWRRLGAPRPFPGNRSMALAALLTGLAAFALRLVWPVGTEVWGLQIGYFATYVVLYVTGLLAAPGHWLARWPPAQVLRWRAIAWAALPMLPLVALFGGPWLGLQGRPEGGFSVPALVYALWEPLVAWGVILSLLQRTRLNWQNPGPLGQALARRAFAIFIIHPPVVVGVALAWASVAAPPLLKFALTGTAACLICFVLAGVLLQVPGLRRVL